MSRAVLGGPRSLRAPRLLTLALAGGLLAPLLALTGPAVAAPTAPGAPAAARPAPAAPRTAAEATAQAEALRTEVDRLTVAAEQASEDYNDARGRLADVVTRHLLAQRQLDDARARTGAGRTAADDRARQVYMSGSPLALYATVLDGADLHDVLTRMEAVRGLVGQGVSEVRGYARYATDAAVVEARLADLTAEQRRLEAATAASAADVTAALEQVQQLLASADATVVRLAEQERAAAQARAEAAFAAQLAAAQQAAAQQAAARAGAGAAGTLVLGPAGSNPVGSAAVQAARAQIGRPYVWGATGPSAFDCSGLTGWAYDAVGVRLPRTSRQQWYAGPHVALADLQPGDLLFWANDVTDPATIHHVAIYAGGGRMIAAPRAGTLVREQGVYSSGYIGAVRPVASVAAGVAGPAWRRG